MTETELHFPEGFTDKWLKLQLDRTDTNGFHIDGLLNADVIDKEPQNLATTFQEFIEAKLGDMSLLKYYKSDFGIDLYLKLKKKFGNVDNYYRVLALQDFVKGGCCCW
ncbi:unnamed protein product [Ambrosiozyma monospora]|uniref:Unnamed protein product n=1 Tax=Ambrosiozyma monospora TaxID=43982 RepID=A0ACB5U9K1_AMBMO|nr:unnamed protein product [Ambrosiozyma monospora]